MWFDIPDLLHLCITCSSHLMASCLPLLERYNVFLFVQKFTFVNNNCRWISFFSPISHPFPLLLCIHILHCIVCSLFFKVTQFWNLLTCLWLLFFSCLVQADRLVKIWYEDLKGWSRLVQFFFYCMHVQYMHACAHMHRLNIIYAKRLTDRQKHTHTLACTCTRCLLFIGLTFPNCTHVLAKKCTCELDYCMLCGKVLSQLLFGAF